MCPEELWEAVIDPAERASLNNLWNKAATRITIPPTQQKHLDSVSISESILRKPLSPYFTRPRQLLG